MLGLFTQYGVHSVAFSIISLSKILALLLVGNLNTWFRYSRLLDMELQIQDTRSLGKDKQTKMDTNGHR